MQNETKATTVPPPARILIVDDETAQRRALCDTLQDEGYVTFGFGSPRLALAEIRAQKFDLMLTDLMMPEMDGISLLKQALELDPTLVGIVMTGEGTIATAVEAMKAGAFDFILKPFKLSIILPALSRALAMRRLRMENVELESSLRRHALELEVANKELEAFSYSVSHDLRAPLRHINFYLHTLSGDPSIKSSDSAGRLLKSITKSADQMNKLIDDLLAFSRMARAEMYQVAFNMGEQVQALLEEMASDLEGRNIEWNIQPLPVVRGDRALLKQVWMNLLSNAVKYTRPRNPAKIQVSWLERDGEWEFCVRDNGVGFDMKYAGKLFGVFQRLHDAQEFEGTGVGLANVRRIVSRHGGKTWAESKPDEGTAIYFTLQKASQAQGHDSRTFF